MGVVDMPPPPSPPLPRSGDACLPIYQMGLPESPLAQAARHVHIPASSGWAWN